MQTKPNTLDLVSNLNLEAERKFASQSNRAARVKIERGHAWLTRFLPFPQGPAKQPFARLAQHWVGGRPFMCMRHTSPDFGGNPEAACPVCDVSEQMHSEATNQQDQDEFYGVQARISYRSYCLVFVKENDRGDKQTMSDEEMLTAYEFNIPKSSFPLLAAKIDRSKSRANGKGLGLLDLETGTDLWSIRDKKNSLTFDLAEESGPIFTLDDQFDEKLRRVWKQLKQPTIKFLEDSRLDTVANMIAEKAFERAAKSLEFGAEDGGGRSSGRNGGSRGHSHEAEEDAPSARGSSRGGSSRSNGYTRAQAALAEPEQEQPARRRAVDEVEDQVPGLEMPPREEAPARVSTRRAPVETSEPANTETDTQDGQQEDAPPVSPRRAGAGSPRTAAPTRVAVPAGVAAGRRAAGNPPPPPAPKQTGGRVEDISTAEEPPEEERDPAPPQDGQPEEAPAPSRSPSRGALQGELRKSVTTMAQRGR